MNEISELKNQIEVFVAAGSRESLENWFFDCWIDSVMSREATALYQKIEGILAEASHANWQDSVLRMELAAAIRPFGSPAFQRVRDLTLEFGVIRKPPSNSPTLLNAPQEFLFDALSARAA